MCCCGQTFYNFVVCSAYASHWKFGVFILTLSKSMYHSNKSVDKIPLRAYNMMFISLVLAHAE